jgi:CO/xanthine dehydrogenase Mo-binding subunit
MPTIPAILNAIHDAMGVRINELPITAERVFDAIKESECQK